MNSIHTLGIFAGRLMFRAYIANFVNAVEDLPRNGKNQAKKTEEFQRIEFLFSNLWQPYSISPTKTKVLSRVGSPLVIIFQKNIRTSPPDRVSFIQSSSHT